MPKMPKSKYPHLTLRGNMWWIDVTNKVYGKVREATGETDEDKAYLVSLTRLAEAASAQATGVSTTSTPVPAQGSGMTLEEGFRKAMRTHWKLNCKASYCATVEHDWKAVVKLLGCDVSKLRLSQINTSMLTEFRVKLHEAGYELNTVKHKLSIISTVLNLAVDSWGELEYLPKIPSIPKPKSKKLPMMEKDYQLAYEYLGKGYGKRDLDVRDVLAVAWNTGARLSEMLKLTDHDIDLELGAVRFYDTKNDPRSIPVNQEVLDILKGRMGNKGGKPFADLSKDYVGHTWARLRKVLKIDQRVSFHSTRHAVITRLFDMNLPTAKVQAYVGHRQAETTAGYTHLGTSGLADCAKALRR